MAEKDRVDSTNFVMKWDDFKFRKEQQMKDYVNQKKSILRACQFSKLIKTFIRVKRIYMGFEERVENKLHSQKLTWVTFKLMMRMKRAIKK